MEEDRVKVNMAKARARFPEIVKLAEDGAIVRVDRYTKPAAVIISWERFQEMEEDIEDLKAVLEMNREIAEHGITGGTLEEVMAEAERLDAAGDHPKAASA